MKPNRMTRSLPALVLAIAGLLALGSPAFACHHDKADTGKEASPEAENGTAADPHAKHTMMLQAAPKDDTRANGIDIPDVTLLDQDGREVRFRTDLIDDKVVAMNFVFTTCTTICPPMGAIFGRLQKDLGDRVGEDFHLISVSIDPVVDTPERLKSWAGKFGAAPGWTLVTGDKLEVDRLLKALGVFTPDFSEHSPILLVGNAERGEWIRAYGMTPPARIAGLLEDMSQGEKPTTNDTTATEARGR